MTLCMFPDDISPTRNKKIVLVLSGEEGKAEKTEIKLGETESQCIINGSEHHDTRVSE